MPEANRARSRFLALAAALPVGLVASPVPAHEPEALVLERLDAELRVEQSASLLLARADVRREMGRWDDAVQDCRAALLLDGDLAPVHLCLSRIALDRGDAHLAVREARTFLDHEQTAAGYRALGRALAERELPGSAADAWKEAILLADPPLPEDFLEAARSLSAAGRAEEGIAVLDDGLARLGPIDALETRAAEMESRLGRHAEALWRVDRLLSRAPRKESWLAERGLLLLRAGREPEAWVAFSDALAALETLPPAHRATPAMRRLDADLRARLRP